MSRINVTKAFLPPIEKYQKYLDAIWQSDQLTNQGPLLRQLEDKLKNYLGADDLHFVTNGTLALQLALRSLDINGGQVITTPFSYVATVSSILWENCQPVFVDIDPKNYNLDPDKIEAAITPQTKAIMAVHVYGLPCDIDKIQQIADKHNLKVIYDGAQAFGTKYKGKSLLDYGDISTCSFHSTKVFHTIEGGAVICKDKQVGEKIELMLRFGHHGDDHRMLGLNAKASEFQAAMGLCNLDYIDDLIRQRKQVSSQYDSLLSDFDGRIKLNDDTEYNYSYYPILFKDEKTLLNKFEKLTNEDIYPRRYFYPSLNQLKYLDKKFICPVSEDIASRVLCLPLYPGLTPAEVEKISSLVK